MLMLGFALATAALFNPDATLMQARDFSWLPAAGLVLLVVGLLECLDAAIAKEPADFFLHVQNGVLDTVVGTLIVFSIADHPSRLSLLVSGFLLIRGVLRIVMVRAAHLERRLLTLVGGGLSALLGFLIWVEWPSGAAWFLAFCLGMEIGFRGLALITLSGWRRNPGN